MGQYPGQKLHQDKEWSKKVNENTFEKHYKKRSKLLNFSSSKFSKVESINGIRLM